MMIKIGGVEAVELSTRQERLSMLLWGKSGCGKTVLASTAPGKILWLNFDSDGVASLDKRDKDKITVVDFSNMSHDKVPMWKAGENVEATLRTALTSNPDIATIVFDSVTSFSALALSHSVLSGKANGGQFKATMELVGQQGYGIRNRLVQDAVNMVLRVTGALNRNCIFICHEKSPELDKEGAIKNITLLLGGQLAEEVPLKISEVWHLSDDNGKRTIGFRPYALRSPMRTRMFRHQGRAFAFPFTYDMQQGSGDGITTWYEMWKDSGFDKIAVPT